MLGDQACHVGHAAWVQLRQECHGEAIVQSPAHSGVTKDSMGQLAQCQLVQIAAHRGSSISNERRS